MNRLAVESLGDTGVLVALARVCSKETWSALLDALPSSPAVDRAYECVRKIWHQRGLATLSGKQRQAYDAVMRGETVFLSGPAGNGKTYLLRLVVEGLRLHTNRRVEVTATTNSAAVNLELGASTLHSFAGLGLGDKPLGEYLTQGWKIGKLKKKWTEVDVLVVDEISMLSPSYWTLLGETARYFRCPPSQRKRKNPSVSSAEESNAPWNNGFGGLQLVLTGDFFQLPPVNRESLVTHYCFETELWKVAVRRSYVLDQPQRQKGDVAFAKLLNRCRLGKPSSADVVFLRALVGPPVSNDQGGKVVTRMRSLRRDVEAINAAALLALPGKETILVARYGRVDPPKSDSGAADDRIKKAVADAQVEERLALKIGSRVLLVANLAPERGLVKGCRGTVVDFCVAPSNWPGTLNSAIMKRRKRLGFGGHLVPEKCPVVEFEIPCPLRGTPTTRLVVPRWIWESKVHDYGDIFYEHFPLLGADAITCHRAQGLTLPSIEVRMDSSMFAPGQGYVAMSRVPSSSGLRFTSFEEKAIHADPKVLQFYESLQDE